MNDLKPELLGDESPLNEMAERAIQQFIGFHHASMGLPIESLVQAMGLTAEEWEVIRTDCIFTENDLKTLDKYFYGEDE